MNQTPITYTTWDVSDLAMPARSRLYHLQPARLNTSLVESLSSYVTRLAQAHCLTVGRLVHFMASTFPEQKGIDYLRDNLRLHGHRINAPQSVAERWIAILEVLTDCYHCHRLTWLPWREVLAGRGLMRHRTAWCPLCYEAWQTAGSPVAMPLLWTLNVVTVCPRHRRPLHTHCPHCQKQPHLISGTFRVGFCSYCHRWLGGDYPHAQRDTWTDDQFREALWQAEAVAELLARPPASPPTKQRIAEVTNLCVQHVTQGSVIALARHVSLPYYTIQMMRKGTWIPALEALLHFCRGLDLTLHQFFTADNLPHFLPRVLCSPPPKHRQVQRRQVLKEAAAAETPPSLIEVADELGLSPARLRVHFPDECAALAVQQRARQRQRRWRGRDLRPLMGRRDLAPIGIGTPLVESLTSYIIRWAAAHDLQPGELRRSLVDFPMMADTPLDHIGQAKLWLNSMEKRAAQWVRHLAVLTGYENLSWLTWLPWRNFLIWQGLVQPLAVWCPLCYQERRANDQPIYTPLIWGTQAVEVCPVHNVLLVSHCPHCGKRFPALDGASRLGHCLCCQGWLGTMSPTAPITTGPEGKLKIWRAQATGALLAYAPSLVVAPDKARMMMLIQACLDRLAGSTITLAEFLGISITALRGYQQGKTKPSLVNLLQICQVLDISPPDVLTHHDLPVLIQNVHLPAVTPLFNSEAVHQLMVDALSSDNPPSLAQVARASGHGPATLKRHFPELCQALSAQYAQHVVDRKAAKIAATCREIRLAVQDLHAQGIFPSGKKVCALIGQSSFLWYRQEFQQARLETMQALGLIDE